MERQPESPPTRAAHARRPAWSVAALVAALAALAAGLVWTAWLADDAFITFRSMDHLVHGRGLVWNVGERVQAFTNPLWLFLLALPYAWSGDVYGVAIGAGFLGTAVATALVVRGASAAGTAALGVLLLACSKAFLEYSTSGLENPLVHVAALLAVGAYLSPAPPEVRAGRIAWASSVAFLARPDGVVLAGVLCAAAWLERPTLGAARRVLVGWSPVAAWELFSLVYFGALVPNTALSKLGGELPRDEVLLQGLRYLENSLRWDPVTLATVGAALLVAAPRPGRWARREAVVALALLAHVAYVVRVGGDFMTGRFLTSPFVVAVALIARARPASAAGRGALGAAAAVAVALAVVPARSPWRPRPGPLAFLEATAPTGITDERAVYYAFTGLVSPGHPAWGKLADGAPYPPAQFARKELAEGKRVQTHATVGMLGFYAGPEVHVVDVMGLGDPLLARLPITTPDGESLYGRKRNSLGRFWRIGHNQRELPEGYRESLEAGENRLRHAALARYYDAVRALTRAPLWSRARWRTLVGFYRGGYAEDLAAWRRDTAARLGPPAGG